MLLSCVLFSAMGAFVNAVQLREPEVSSFACSFVRLLVNLGILVVSAGFARDLRSLTGDGRVSLWLRGLFGSISLVTSFAAIKAIGIGESSFLHSSNAFFVALLTPWILGQRNPRVAWIAIAGAMLGLFVLLQPRFDDVYPWGRISAVISGLFAALAYLMIARAGTTNSPRAVIFYFCIVGLALHSILFLFVPVSWPQHTASWIQLLGAGIAASVAQVFLTKSWQLAPPALNAAVSYTGPVLSMLVSVALFNNRPDVLGWIGVVIILVCGVWLPFAKIGRTRPAWPY